MNTSLVVVIGYLAIVTFVGSMATRRNATSTDWAVAGGGMGVWMIAVGAAGTRIGGAGTYGVAGDVMTGGVWNMWWYGIGTFLAMAVIGLFFAIPYRRARIQTVGEIFTLRFGGRRNQVLTSLCVQIEYFIVNVIEAYIIAVILKGLTGLDMMYGVVVAAFVLISYVTLGGLWGAAITNLIHCVVILVGLALVGLMGVNQLGGWAVLVDTVNGHIVSGGGDLARFWSIAGAGWMPIFAMMFSTVVHTPAASVYTNYSAAAKHEKVLLPSFLLAGVMGGLMPIFAGVIGLLTIAHYGLDSGTSGYANLTQVAAAVHPLIGSIALAAVLAAVISSGGPILLASSTMFVRDWLRFADRYTPERKLKAYRVTTVCYGLIAAAIAWVNSAYLKLSVLDMLLFGFAMVVPPALSVAYLIYWKKTTEQGAFWGMASGFIGGLLWFACIQWADVTGFTLGENASSVERLLHWCFVHDGEGVDPSYVTTFVPLVVVPIVSLLTQPREDANAARFYDVIAGRAEARFSA